MTRVDRSTLLREIDQKLLRLLEQGSRIPSLITTIDRFADKKLMKDDKYARIGVVVIWNEISMKDIADADKESVVILPVGSTEGHGPHLPLGTDTLFAYRISLEVGKRTGALVLPPLSYGYNPEAKHFAGSISLSANALLKVLEEVCDETARNGFKKIVLFNGHGGNVRVLRTFMNEALNKDKDYQIYAILNPWEPIFDLINEVKETSVIGHACEIETSIVLGLRPDLVKPDRIVLKGELGDPSVEFSRLKCADKTFIPHTDTMMDWVGYCTEGYIGDPKKASRQKGEKLVNSLIEEIVKVIEMVKKDKKTAKAIEKYKIRKEAYVRGSGT